MNEFKIIFSSFKDILRHPYLAIPPIILLFFTIFSSRLSVYINYKLSTTPEILGWLIFYVMAFLLFLSYILTGLIALCKNISLKESPAFKAFFSSANKFWLKNFFIILITLLVYNIIRRLTNDAAFYLGKSLGLSLDSATIFLFYPFYFLGLALIIIYLTLASFALVIKQLSIKESIKQSIALVKKNYLFVFSTLLIFFVINKLLEFINKPLFQEIINSILLIPLLALIFTKITLSEK